tara:strand:+ start:17997 stop:18422 length:426 start_codon:yes stop_codon:yes gene_type:complete
MTPLEEAPNLDTAFTHLTEGLRVLLVEDNADQKYLVERYFRGSTAVLHWETHGKAALELLKEEDFDLFILDIMLPDLDGWEVFSEIRKIAQFRRTPVLFMTCVVPQSLEYPSSDENGFCRTLAKPAKRSTFRKAIAALLSH